MEILSKVKELDLIENEDLKFLLYNSLAHELERICNTYDLWKEYSERVESIKYEKDKKTFIDRIKNNEYNHFLCVRFDIYLISDLVLTLNDSLESHIRVEYVTEKNSFKINWGELNSTDIEFFTDRVEELYDTNKDHILLKKKNKINNLKKIYLKKMELFCESFLIQYHNFYKGLNCTISNFMNDCLSLQTNISIVKSLHIDQMEFFHVKNVYIRDVIECLRDKFLEEGYYIKFYFLHPEENSISINKTL